MRLTLHTSAKPVTPIPKANHDLPAYVPATSGNTDSSTHGSEETYEKLLFDGLKEQLAFELGSFILREEDAMTILSQRLIEGGIADPTEFAQSVLDQCKGYSSQDRQWTDLTVVFRKELSLLPVFGKIFTQIRKHVSDRLPQLFRGEMKDTHDRSIAHYSSSREDFKTYLKSSPDFMNIEYSGCHCSDPSPEYCHARQVLDIKLDSNTSVNDDGIQLALYCRQILIDQPSRRFVLSFIFTQERVRLYGFDRSGGWYSESVDFHKRPLALIYAVAFLFLAHDHAIGLDQHNAYDGTSRTITLPAGHRLADGSKSVDPLVGKSGKEPLMRRRTIRGRATTCWAFEIDGRQYLLKDYWRPVGRPSEAGALVKARGLKGIGQMIAYYEDIEKISDLRRSTNFIADKKSMTERTHCQLVLERYDGCLTMAPTPLALLVAFRDAVQGEYCTVMWVAYNSLILE